MVVSASSQVPDVIGSYALKVEADTTMKDRYHDSADRASPISFGTVYQGAISPATDLDYLSFPAERGAVYIVQLTYGTAGAVDMAVKSQNSDNEPLARNFGASDAVRWVSPDGDTYYVELSASPRIRRPDRHLFGEGSIMTGRCATGTATRFRRPPVLDWGTRSPEPSVRWTTAYYFYFAAERGFTYTVSVAAGTTETVGIIVENPQIGFSISNFEAENWVEWTAPQTGGYLFLISAAGRTEEALGTYQLTVTRSAQSPVEQPTGQPAAEPMILPGRYGIDFGFPDHRPRAHRPLADNVAQRPIPDQPEFLIELRSQYLASGQYLQRSKSVRRQVQL